ncbi:MAG: hypothetical protein WB992_18385 [Bryobacteraceae bacterium]
MSLNRRGFCSSLGASALSMGFKAANPNRALRSADIIGGPTSIHVFTENETLQLKRDRTSWSADGILVSTEAGANQPSLRVSISSPTQRLLRLRLRWQGSLPHPERILGDAWERSYGDLGWYPLQPERILPWYFLAGSGESYIGMGVQTGAGALCFWQTTPSDLVLWLDVRNGGRGVELGNRSLPAATVISEDYERHSGFEAARKLCRRMAQDGIFMPAPMYGGNNWYYAYGHSSADNIRADTERIASWAPSGPNRPFMVIDDGWSPYATTGPWKEGKAQFPDMARLASDMLGMGVKPGLWFRPLSTKDTVSETLLLKSKFAESLYANEQLCTLDPTVEGAAEHIKTDVKRLCGWGFQLLKHDFSTFDLLGRWGFQMGSEITQSQWNFADRTRTNAEIVRAFYRTLREAAGTTPLLGCNTIGHLSTGLFEVERIGDDTSGRDWSRTRKMGVNTLAFRSPQQGAFFDVDADCVGLTNAIPWSLNRRWLDLLARSGTPLFVSAAPDAIKQEQRDALREAFSRAALRQPLCEPLDWFATTQPEHWRLGANVSHFDWYSEDTSLPI